MTQFDTDSAMLQHDTRTYVHMYAHTYVNTPFTFAGGNCEVFKHTLQLLCEHPPCLLREVHAGTPLLTGGSLLSHAPLHVTL